QTGCPPIAQPEPLARLCARRNSQQRLALHRGHFYLRSERGLGNGDRHRAIDIIALAREIRMLTDVGNDVEIARLIAQLSRVALVWDADTRARVDAGRY